MTNKYNKYSTVGLNTKGSQINQSMPKLSNKKQEILHQELKSSGAIDNPVKYTETNL